MDANFDILSNVLNSMHICGNLLLYESYNAPWSISIPQGHKLGKLLDIKPGTRVVAFHLVERGYLEIASTEENTSQESSLTVGAGEMVICFSGTAHRIFQGNSFSSFPVKNVLAGTSLPFRSQLEKNYSSVSCICGVFYLEDTYLNPLFASLPPILHASLSQIEAFQNLSGVANLVVRELEQRSPGSDFMVQRLLEVLCAGAIRNYIDKLQSQEPSWLIGLRDPVISKILSIIHAQPGNDWSVETLAKSVDLSPSRFAARFKEIVGESPMSYVSEWRIHVASCLLKTTESNVSEIAFQVGYENLAAFNRAFKRHLNMPPGAWRALHVD